MADKIVQPKVKTATGYDNMIIQNANNSNKIQNIDFKDNSPATFGDYVVTKKKIINNSVIIYNQEINFSDTINTGDELEVYLYFGEDSVYRPYRFIVSSYETPIGITYTNGSVITICTVIFQKTSSTSGKFTKKNKTQLSFTTSGSGSITEVYNYTNVDVRISSIYKIIK